MGRQNPSLVIMAEGMGSRFGDRMERYFQVSYVFQELERLPEGISRPDAPSHGAPAMRWPAARAW